VAALFPRWSNTAMRLGLGALGCFLVGVPTALIIYVRTPYVTNQQFTVEQPVEFDHRHHVADDGIDCRYCHDTVDRSRFAGVPPTARCMSCHSQVWDGSPMLEPVRRSWFTGRPIPWRRVHRLPDFAYFDHSVHVTHGVGCATCHGRVDTMSRVYQVAPLTMGWCLDCHRAPERFLRPRDQITSMTWEPQGNRAELGARLAREYGTRKLTSCTTCHR
jgi:cytochrome c7-like protein